MMKTVSFPNYLVPTLRVGMAKRLCRLLKQTARLGSKPFGFCFHEAVPASPTMAHEGGLGLQSMADN
jgi:hypothetical protein